MSRANMVLLVLLVVMVIVSALGVVHAKFDSRRLFVELQEMGRQRDAVDVEWGKLQLEFASLGTHGRVEKIAVNRLQMQLPGPEAVIVLWGSNGR